MDDGWWMMDKRIAGRADLRMACDFVLRASSIIHHPSSIIPISTYSNLSFAVNASTESFGNNADTVTSRSVRTVSSPVVT